MTRAHAVLMTGLALAALLLTIVSVAVGYAPLDLGRAFSDWLHGADTLARVVLIELRLPRALLGLVGFSLGITGAAMQGLLRNPLAEPGIIGVSAAPRSAP